MDKLNIIAQQFYGNRTGTGIRRDCVDHFLRGCVGDGDFEDVKDVVRKIVRIPGADSVVIVYDQTQENEYVHVRFPEIYARDGADYLARWGEELKMPVSCEIPEIGFKIHSRCFACRMDADGVLQSLRDIDRETVLRYFPGR